MFEAERHALGLFERALELPEDQRHAWLQTHSSCNPEVAECLARLMQADRSMTDFLEGDVFSLLGDSVARVPEQIGHYRIVRLLGEGGTGSVYLGHRAGDFEHEATIKLFRRQLLSPKARSRFESERQILARLRHPNIAQLYDGGSTPEGLPYVIMEFVDATPIDIWVREKCPDVGGIIELIVQLCGALQYAHQNLVVHGDIKPANVHVTSDGLVKLLDFSIARELDGETGESGVLTASATGMTAAFASPEQQRGVVSTASDIHSVGVLLYLLVTGRLPDKGMEPASAEPIKGEIGEIIAHAMIADPARRYASAGALAEDLRRFLAGLPLSMREHQTGYRLRKFLARHRIAVPAAGLAAASLVILLLVTLVQYHEAKLQRERADQRFQQVRELARSVMFELHDKIASIPGTTAARLLLVETGQKYLDNLAADRNAPADVRLDLSQGYIRLGDVLGNPRYSHLGKDQKARANYRKAEDQLSTLLAELPTVKAFHLLHEVQLDLGTLELYSQNDPVTAHGRFLSALQTAERWQKFADGRDSRLAVAEAHTDIGSALIWNNQMDTAIEEISSGLQIYSNEHLEAAEGYDAGRRVAAAHSLLADAFYYSDRYPEALEHYLESESLWNVALQSTENDSRVWRGIEMAHFNLGGMYYDLGDLENSIRHYRQQLHFAEMLDNADPQDERATRELSIAHNGLALSLSENGQSKEALEHLDVSLRLRQSLLDQEPENPNRNRDMAVLYRVFAETFDRMGGDPESGAGADARACGWWHKAQAQWHSIEKGWGTVETDRKEIARVEQRVGECKQG